jgi:aminoglycoside phosphotransferase (APT) family kinase protein
LQYLYARSVKGQVEEFVCRRWAVPRDRLRLVVQPVRGGLESVVARVTIATAPSSAGAPDRLVVKQLSPAGRREAEVYGLLWTHVQRPPTARVLGVHSAGEMRYLFLEDVRARSAWPWADTGCAAAVCRELARFHDDDALPRVAFAWDYDAELRRSAHATLAVALHARTDAGDRIWRRWGDLKRVVSALESIRARLAASDRTVIHGDVHPGNVILRDDAVPQVALIDWGRARLGSPLEDVASWLHSLGCWEPQVRRRHDSLLKAYFESRRTPQALDAGLRELYWYASASNGLAGAIRYHLAVLGDRAAAQGAIGDSRRALFQWERVVRRAAALLSTSRDR